MLAPITEQERMLRENSPEWWEKEGEKKALATFHQAAERVPAYKDFLKKHNVNPEKVVTIEDFKKNVPVMTKKDYLRQYPLKDLCWDGDLSRMNVISVSSGSTGEPFFWPRDIWQEREVDSWYELVLTKYFHVNTVKTLFIVSYSMGMYVAGPFTYASLLRIAQKGYPLTVATPGIELEDILKVLDKLSSEFGQVIIAAYPPFAKDILDSVDYREILKNKKIKFIFGAESFTEKWRDHISKRASDQNESLSTIGLNTYGSADSAILAMETEASISIRKYADGSEKVQNLLFFQNRVPAFFQYNPLFKYFEQNNSELAFTSASGIPLVRYAIGDSGGVITFRDLLKKLGKSIPAIKHELHLPFVYLFERSDFTVHLYGVNIYIENVKSALDTIELQKYFSGKFSMNTKVDSRMEQRLMVFVELAEGVEASSKLKDLVTNIIVSTMKLRNSEYNRLSSAVGKKAKPLLKLLPYGNKKYFRRGTKQQWKTAKI